MPELLFVSQQVIDSGCCVTQTCTLVLVVLPTGLWKELDERKTSCDYFVRKFIRIPYHNYSTKYNPYLKSLNEKKC